MAGRSPGTPAEQVAASAGSRPGRPAGRPASSRKHQLRPGSPARHHRLVRPRQVGSHRAAEEAGGGRRSRAEARPGAARAGAAAAASTRCSRPGRRSGRRMPHGCSSTSVPVDARGRPARAAPPGVATTQLPPTLRARQHVGEPRCRAPPSRPSQADQLREAQAVAHPFVLVAWKPPGPRRATRPGRRRSPGRPQLQLRPMAADGQPAAPTEAPPRAGAGRGWGVRPAAPGDRCSAAGSWTGGSEPVGELPRVRQCPR